MRQDGHKELSKLKSQVETALQVPVAHLKYGPFHIIGFKFMFVDDYCKWNNNVKWIRIINFEGKDKLCKNM